MRPKNFDLIAFDWDGTLYDSTQIIVRCIQAAVVDVGGQRPTDEAAAYVIGLGLMEALAHAAPDVPTEKYPALGERYRHHYRLHYDDIVLFDGAIAMLHELKSRGHLLAVATGKSRRGLDEVLASPDLKGIFHSSRTADETAGKPDPRMLHELIEQFNLTPERVLMIGDTTHDLAMARNARCPSVGVSYGAHAPDAFEVLAPRHIAHSIADLRAWLVDNG